MQETIGSGTRVGTTTKISGTARYVDGPATVITLMEEDLSNTILVVHEAGTTGVAPVLPDALGVICTSGGPTSHLALVAREFGVACVMAAKLDRDPEALQGLAITINEDGSVSIETGG